MVSVIVPVYNAARYIEQTIQSVINQSYDNWELILVDDGSVDNSIEIINAYTDADKIFLFQHPSGVNLGVSKSRELGITVAKGEYIAFLDADDVFYPSKLRSQLNIFANEKNIILVHSKVEILNDFELTFNNEFVLAIQDKVYVMHEQENWLRANKICNSTVIVKADIIKNIQFGLPQLFQYEDWVLWSLVAEKGEFYYQNDPQIKYRVHPNSATTAVMKNRLVSPFSKIEYLLSLYFLNSSNRFNSEIIEQLREAIIRLMEIYSNGNTGKVNSFRTGIYNRKGDGEIYIKKYNELSIKYDKLVSRHVNLQKELQNIKKSIWYRFLRKFKII